MRSDPLSAMVLAKVVEVLSICRQISDALPSCTGLDSNAPTRLRRSRRRAAGTTSVTGEEA